MTAKKMTPRRAAMILASLAEQRRDVELGLLPAATYEERAKAARDLGLNVPRRTS